MNLSVFIIFLFIFCFAISLSESHAHKKKRVVVKGPIDKSVQDKKLIIKKPEKERILTENEMYYNKVELKRFSGEAMGFVTPWNSHGYYMAETFAPKFNYISPTWFQVIHRDEFVAVGNESVDLQFLQTVREASNITKIVPRFAFEEWTPMEFGVLASDIQEVTQLGKLFVTTAREISAEGIVVEIWSQMMTSVGTHVIVPILRYLADMVHEHNLMIFLVIPPTRGYIQETFEKKHFDQLEPFFDGFFLMTYDYTTSSTKPGPNGPLWWSRENVERLIPKATDQRRRAKIFLGTNFYGNDYNKNGVAKLLNHQYLDLLETFDGSKLSFDSKDEENYFEFSDESGKHMVWYPTLYSIQQRILLAEELGTGIGIWEMGQGLNYFYDLF